MSKKVAQVIVDTLQSAGVKNCYGIVAPEAVYGMAMYSIKAVMHGKAGDVFEMIGENL
jgi:thiamine pyrophosphate-dependent acetolactate synthase large subunit-like protein